jgi:hypothetical protein
MKSNHMSNATVYLLQLRDDCRVGYRDLHLLDDLVRNGRRGARGTVFQLKAEPDCT